jgi:hypothetical protein
MKLSAYFDRIGYAGPARTDIATLTALHRAHTEAIPFENLDVQLGRRIEITPEAIFDKLVTRRRGGWCRSPGRSTLSIRRPRPTPALQQTGGALRLFVMCSSLSPAGC